MIQIIIRTKASRSCYICHLICYSKSVRWVLLFNCDKLDIVKLAINGDYNKNYNGM